MAAYEVTQDFFGPDGVYRKRFDQFDSEESWPSTHPLCQLVEEGVPFMIMATRKEA